MSETFVKLSMASRQVGYLRAEYHPGVRAKNTNSNLGIELSGNPVIKIASGKDAGELLEDTVLKANQKVSIELGVFKPHRFHGHLIVNPELTMAGTVAGPVLVEPDEATVLGFTLRPDHQIDLADIKWMMRIYLID